MSYIFWIFETLYYRVMTSTIVGFMDWPDDTADEILTDCLKYNIKSFEDGGYTPTVAFDNGVSYEFWDTGSRFSFTSSGTFTFKNGDKYTYDDSRVKVKSMYQLKQRLRPWRGGNGGKPKGKFTRA